MRWRKTIICLLTTQAFDHISNVHLSWHAKCILVVADFCPLAVSPSQLDNATILNCKKRTNFTIYSL